MSVVCASIAWRWLAGELRHRIRVGELAPGSLLPSEACLEQETGLSRTTIRRAVAELRAEGLVTTNRPTGSLVLGGDLVVLGAGDEVTVNDAGALVVRRADGSVALHAVGTRAVHRQLEGSESPGGMCGAGRRPIPSARAPFDRDRGVSGLGCEVR